MGQPQALCVSPQQALRTALLEVALPGPFLHKLGNLLFLAAAADIVDDQADGHPDGGIDIFARSRDGTGDAAFQCKAYPRFRSDLLRSAATSAAAAARSRPDYAWDQYVLVVPFIPSSGQRIKIEAALRHCGGAFQITDADELEATLFRYPDIARKIFTMTP